MSASSPILHPSSFSSSDCLPIDQAADLLGLPLRTLRYRCANQWAKRGLAEQRPPAGGNGKPIWWIHRSVDPRLVPCPDRQTRQDQARESLLQRHPRHLVERAYRKAFWLDKWRKRCTRPRLAGQTERSIAQSVIDEAKQVEGPEFRISLRSLQTWWCSYNQLGDDGHILGVGILIDDYNGPGKGDVNGDPPHRSPEAIQYFYGLYHTQNGFKIKTCHQVTCDEARDQAWSWPPGYAATARWLRKTDDLSLTFLLREGPQKWAHKFLPHLEIDYGLLQPGEFFVCDHTQVDFWVAYRGQQIRPWLTAVEDLRSRCIVGWHLGPAPHQDAILSALRLAYRDWAIPQRMRIDNGKDFTSKLLTGVTKAERNRLRQAYGRNWYRVLRRDAHLIECTDTCWLGITGELGVDLIYAIPYSPWSKGPVERWYGTFENQCGKTFATYCGNSALAKPECLEEIRRGYSRDQKRQLRKKYGKDWKRIAVLKFVDQSAVPTLEQARERVATYIELYHRTEHRGQAMDGRTPLAVWNTAVRLRRAVADQLLFLMNVRGAYRVGANGVSLRVGSATLGYGATCQALRPYVGRDVLIAIDTNNIGQCWALSTGKRKLIARLEANRRMPPFSTADDAREAIVEIKRDQSIMHKARRSAARQTVQAGERIARHQRERLAELRKTGTDDVAPAPNIVPVPTGFEDLSLPSRTGFEADSYRPPDSGELEDLFEGNETFDPVGQDDDGDIEDLFVNQPADEESDEGLDDLL